MKELREFITEALINEAKKSFGKRDESLNEFTFQVGNSDVVCGVYFNKVTTIKPDTDEKIESEVCYIAADWLNNTVWFVVTADGKVMFRTINNKEAINSGSLVTPYSKSRVVQMVNGTEYKSTERHAYKLQVTLSGDEKKNLMSKLKEMTTMKGDLFDQLKKTVQTIDDAQ